MELRRHYILLVILVLLVALLVLGLGNQRIRAYTSRTKDDEQPAVHVLDHVVGARHVATASRDLGEAVLLRGA